VLLLIDRGCFFLRFFSFSSLLLFNFTARINGMTNLQSDQTGSPRSNEKSSKKFTLYVVHFFLLQDKIIVEPLLLKN